MSARDRLMLEVRLANAVVGVQEGEALPGLALHRGVGIDSKNVFYGGAGMVVVNEPPGTSGLSVLDGTSGTDIWDGSSRFMAKYILPGRDRASGFSPSALQLL
jgi:hypothetical protein